MYLFFLLRKVKYYIVLNITYTSKGEYMKESSIWLENIKMNEFPILNNDMSTDVLIIGGGISGILCAYELKKRNIDCVVLEKGKIGQATSKDTTAFLTIHHEKLYVDLINELGKDKAKEYLCLNQGALDKYKELSKEFDFDYKEESSIIYTYEEIDKIFKERDVLLDLGIEAEIINELPLKLNIKAGLKVNNCATIHPLKLINELSKGLTIYEETKIVKLKKNRAITNRGNYISFSNVVICTHYPIHNVKGLYFPRLTQRKSYVVNLKHDQIEGMYTNLEDRGLYYRIYYNNLIVGGNDRDTKETCIHNFLERIKATFPNNEILNYWSGQDCITLDGVPYIGRFDAFHDNYYVVTGFNLWGYTWAMASSKIIADLLEKRKKYPLVDPLRVIINKQLFSNLGTSFKNLFTFRRPRCSHMGCALNYNKEERVYECPCHGSRFDKQGNVLNEPAKKNKNL